MFKVKKTAKIVKNIIKKIALIIVGPYLVISMLYILQISDDSARYYLKYSNVIMNKQNIASIKKDLVKAIININFFFQSYLLLIPIVIIKDILYTSYKNRRQILQGGISCIISSFIFFAFLIFIQYRFGLIGYLLLGQLWMILDLLVSCIFLLKFINLRRIIKSDYKMLKKNEMIVIGKNLDIDKNYKYRRILRKFNLIILIFFIIISIINIFYIYNIKHNFYKSLSISMNYSIMINIICLIIILQNFLSYTKLILILKNTRDYIINNGNLYKDAKKHFWKEENIYALLILLLNIEIILFFVYFKNLISLDFWDFYKLLLLLFIRMPLFYMINGAINKCNSAKKDRF